MEKTGRGTEPIHAYHVQKPSAATMMAAIKPPMVLTFRLYRASATADCPA